MTDSMTNISSHFNAPDRLLIKAEFRNDIRKFFVSNENLTVNILISLIKEIFNGKISISDQLILKYLDNDGDQVTLANDVDLTIALNFHSKLRLFVYLDGEKPTAKTFGEEFKQIRDSIQMILDRCEIPRQSITEEEKAVPLVSSPSMPPTTSHVFQRQHSNGVRSRILNTNRRYSTEPTETTKPTITPFSSPFPHLIPSGLTNQLTPTNSPSTPPTTNPNIPLYATRAFPSARHSSRTMSPSSSSAVSTFIGQQSVPNFFNPKS